MGIYVCESCMQSYGLKDSGAHSCVCKCDVCSAWSHSPSPVWCHFSNDLEQPEKIGVSIRDQLKAYGIVKEKITERVKKASSILKLLVLRCKSIDTAKEFYTLFGIDFVLEKHGKGPEHYAGHIGGFVLELYPIKGQQQEDHQIRLGFQVTGLDEILALVAPTKGAIVKPAHETAHGRKAFVKDPDGRTVELYEKKKIQD